MDTRSLVMVPIKAKTSVGVNALADGYTIKCAPDIKAINIKPHNLEKKIHDCN